MRYLNIFALTVFALVLNATCIDNSLAAPVPDYPAKHISPRVWVIPGPLQLPNAKNKGFINNPGIVLTSLGAVIIDPGSSEQTGEMVLRELKKITPQPVVAVFDTHIHGDHWLGNTAITRAYPNVRIFASQEMITEAKNGGGKYWVNLMYKMTKGASKGTKATIPNTPVVNGETIKIGDTSFHIFHNKQAHTKTDIMIEVMEDHVMFLGDIVGNQRILRMADGNFAGDIAAINIALSSNAKYFVPGHGPGGTRAVPIAYRDYLTGVYLAAKKAFESDKGISGVKAIAEKYTRTYRNWANYKDEIGRHSEQAYQEVEAAEF